MGESIIGGIILSGGKGERIGGKKPFRIFNGKYLINYPSDVLKSLNIPYVTVFAKNSIDLYKEKEYLNKYKCIISFDLIENKGPLMGILCGMRALNAEWFIVLPCDCPYITKESIIKLISYIKISKKDNLCIVPKHENGFIEPLFALYKRNSLHILNKILMEGSNLSLRYFISHLNPFYIKVEELDKSKKIFKNINTIKELKHG
ncbi:putative molybdenum cofactor guanylyltransferase [Methanocaldococcus lauensis]|nr:putative molybdenum cofactor guanylyltransferase [Methanocaldococcus lauensis]